MDEFTNRKIYLPYVPFLDIAVKLFDIINPFIGALFQVIGMSRQTIFAFFN